MDNINRVQGKNLILTKIVSEHNDDEQLCCTSLKLKLLVALVIILEHHFQV